MFFLLIIPFCILSGTHQEVPIQFDGKKLQKIENDLEEIRSIVASDITRADSLARRVLLQVELMEVDSLYSKALYSMGIVHYFKGHYYSSREYFERAKETRHFHQNLEFRSSILNNLGIIYELNGDYSRAMDSHWKSLEISLDKGDSIGIYRSYINIGKLHLMQDNKGSGKSYLMDALEFFGGKQDTLHMALCFHNLMESEESYEMKKDFFQRATELYQAMGNFRGLAMIYIDFTEFVIDSGDVQRARSYLSRLEEFEKRIHDENVRTNIVLTRARYKMLTRELDDAEKLLLSVNESFERMGVNSLKWDVFFDLGLLFALRQKTDKSKFWFGKYAEAMKSVFNRKRAKELAEADALMQQREELEKRKSLQVVGYYQNKINSLWSALGFIGFLGIAATLVFVIKMHSRSTALYQRNMELSRLMDIPVKTIENPKNREKRTQGRAVDQNHFSDSERDGIQDGFSGQEKRSVHPVKLAKDRAGSDVKRDEMKEKEWDQSKGKRENDVSVENLSGDDKAFFHDLFLKIEEYIIGKKVFLNPDLRIGDVAYEMATNEKYISLAFQHGSDQRFNQFINFLRVNEAKKYLSQSKYDAMSMPQIARKTGFRSQSTFQRRFKEYTGMNPLLFKKMGTKYEANSKA